MMDILSYIPPFMRSISDDNCMDMGTKFEERGMECEILANCSIHVSLFICTFILYIILKCVYVLSSLTSTVHRYSGIVLTRGVFNARGIFNILTVFDIDIVTCAMINMMY